MSDVDKAKELFAKIHDALDQAYDMAQGTFDEAFTKVDNFVHQWEARTLEFVEKREVKTEPVKVKPDVSTMRDDLAWHRRAAGLSYHGWEDLDSATIEKWWDELPEGYKSWVKRDKNSPL